MQELIEKPTPNIVFQSLSAGKAGTWQWYTDSDDVWLDKSLVSLLELETDHLSVSECIELIHADDREEVRVHSKAALAGREPFEIEFRMQNGVDSQKSEIWYAARGRLEGKDDEHRLVGVLIDITDRKKLEQEERAAQSQMHFMADSMPQLVWITHADGFHEYYNQRWYNYTGTTPGDTDGEGWKKLFHPEDRERANELWRHSLETGEPYEIEYRLYHAKSDRYRWVIGRARAYHDETGEITKWYGTCTDIDDQKRHASVQTFLATASKELATSLDYQKTLKTVAELCVPQVADWCTVDMYDEENQRLELIAVSHVDHEKVKLVKRYRELHPVTLDQDTGSMKVFKTKEPDFYPVINDEIIKAATKDEEALELIEALGLKSAITVPLLDREKAVGTISFVSSDSKRLFNEEDFAMAEKIASRASLAITNASLYEASLNEIEARKLLEKELLIEKQKLESRVEERTAQLNQTNEGLREEISKRQEIEAELKRSNQELQDFAYVASHDLQEPLRKIQAFGDILKNEYRESLGDGADYLDRMLNAASRMSSLIQDLLAFSRATNSKDDVGTVNLNDVLSGVMDDLSARISDLDAKVEICDLPVVKGDATHMRQLFQNLLSNALKFHKPNQKPHITLCSKETKGLVTFEVKDNGIGFDQKYAGRIFSVFQRLHGRDEYQGTGIGLAVCRKIVEKYGGTITAKSAPDQGATFIVKLRKEIEE